MKQEFIKAIPILQALENAGYEAYFVGGSVRDFLLGRQIGDVDIATSATPIEVKNIFPNTIDVGIEHGTVLVLYKGESFEITTFRTDGEYEDFRRPEQVFFVRSLEEDLKRRDFTMNAIAMDRHENIIDPFGGQQALRTKTITTVGRAEERFQEDGLRMMRAVRFVSQLEFQLDSQTLQGLINHHHLLEHISVERKTTEFEKLLKGTHRRKALNLLVSTDLYLFLPGLRGRRKELLVLSELPIDTSSLIEMWSLICLVCDIEDIDGFLREWKLPVRDMKQIKSVLQYVTLRLEKNWSSIELFDAGISIATKTENVVQCLQGNSNRLADTLQVKQQFEQLPIHTISELDIDGRDLLEWKNETAGPWVKSTLREIIKSIITGDVENRKESILRWLNHNLK